MAWQTPLIQFPPGIKALSDGVDNALSQGRGEIDTALARLDAVNPTYKKNPTATAAQGAAAAQNNLVDLLDAELRLLVVHPWTEGAGQGEGVSRHLSAPNAQRALAAKLRDGWDSHTPTGELEALAVLFAEKTLQGFAARLSAFATVFPLPELRQAERRADQLLRLEAEKSVLPGAPQGGTWRPRRLLQLQPAALAARNVGAEIASAHGYELENTDPTAELAALTAKKQQHLDAVRQATEELAGQFAEGGGVTCLAINGSAREVADQVQGPGPYDHDHVFTAALLFAAAPGELTPLQEFFGL